MQMQFTQVELQYSRFVFEEGCLYICGLDKSKQTKSKNNSK
jgi:hypothetical protein